MAEFYVDIEDNSGNKLGSGPLASVVRWRYSARFDRAGGIEFEFAANDDQADIVQNRRVARAYALIDGAWVEVGAGVIDTIETIPGNDGRVSLRVSGLDLIRELSYRTVGTLEIGAGSGATHAAALTAIEAFAPAGWTFTPALSPDNDYIYARYGGESVLGALVHLAERTQTHFYRSVDRTLVFTSAFTSSGVRAIQARGDLAAETCAIVSLQRSIDTHDLLTRITPYGSGQGAARLTMAATSRSAPVGYTLSAANNYIEKTAATLAYGLVNFPEIEFKEIGPISNTDADLEAAADMLFDAALEELTRRSTLADQETYNLMIAGCSELLRPMQTIRLVYRDLDQNININDDLYILEATWEIDSSGVRTSDLVVSTDDRWPVSDVVAAAERAVEGRVFQAHPQMNANSYVIAYSKNVDIFNIAEFRFRFGSEIVNLQQVLFEFQLLAFESTVLSIGTESGGSGEIPTSGPSTNSTGSGGNNDSGGSGTLTTQSTTPTIGSATPDIGDATPTIGTTTPTIGTTTPTIGNATPTISDATPTIGTTTPTIGSTTPTIGSQGLTTNTPTGGATDGSGDHQHWINVIAGSGSLGEVSLHESGGNFFLANPFVTGSEPVYVTPIGFHTHTLTGHTHTIDVHTHTIASHTHTIGAHSHTIAAHDHTIASHNHTISAHTHTIGAHSHTIAAHNHTIAAHTHTMTAHTHTMSSHTHSLNNHTHDLAEGIEAIYGIFRDESIYLFALDELEYRVNGGSWADLDTATDVDGGWWQLDITSLVMNATTFRPLEANNFLEIRAGSSITVEIDGIIGNHTLNLLNIGVGEDDAALFSIGDWIAVADTGHPEYDGTYQITDMSGVHPGGDPDTLTCNWPYDTPVAPGTAGTVTFIRRSTIDAQLSVRNVIQAISYV